MQQHQQHYLLRKYTRPCHPIQHFPIASFDPLECGRDLFIALKCRREEKKNGNSHYYRCNEPFKMSSENVDAKRSNNKLLHLFALKLQSRDKIDNLICMFQTIEFKFGFY